jgi:hypothetical protein
MRLNKNNQLFRIITNESGVILGISEGEATAFLHKHVGDEIFDLIDASEFRKISMYSSFMSITKSLVKDFPTVIMRVTLKNYIKVIELCFVPKNMALDAAFEKNNDALELYAEKRNEVAIMDPCEYMQKLLDMLKSQKTGYGLLVSINGEAGKLRLSPVCIELIFLTTISMLIDISFKDEIVVSFEDDKITFLLATKSLKGVLQTELLEKYPHIVTRYYFLRSICEDEGIQFDVNVANERIFVSYDISKIAIAKPTFKAIGEEMALRISRFIDTLFA